MPEYRSLDRHQSIRRELWSRVYADEMVRRNGWSAGATEAADLALMLFDRRFDTPAELYA